MSSSSDSTDLQVAIADLNASRARLRDLLVPPPVDPNAPKSKGLLGGISDGVSALWTSIKGGNSGKGSNSGKGGSGTSLAASLALKAVQGWWMKHPWRQVGNTLAEPLSVAAAPLVRRNPWTAVALASVAGALLVQTRPWRWRLVAHQARAVRHQAVRWGLSQVTKPAMQALIATSLASLMSKWNRKNSDMPATRAAAVAKVPGSRAAASPVQVAMPGRDHLVP